MAKKIKFGQANKATNSKKAGGSVHSEADGGFGGKGKGRNSTGVTNAKRRGF